MSQTHVAVLLVCFVGFAFFGGAALLESPGVKWIDTPAGFWRSLSPTGKKLYSVAVIFWGIALATILLAAFG